MAATKRIPAAPGRTALPAGPDLPVRAAEVPGRDFGSTHGADMTSFFLIAIAAAITLVNIPCGYLRRGYGRLAYGWFFYAHLTIPIVVYLRVKIGCSWKFVPLAILCAAAGQVAGGVFRSRNGRPNLKGRNSLES